MMTQQQQQLQPMGQPIGMAPVYSMPQTPPPLATGSTQTPAPTQGNAGQRRWLDGLILGGLVGGGIFCLVTWGVLDGLYSGKDIRALERAATTANATAAAVEQRAQNAEANAQQWEQHAGEQQSQLDKIREVLGCK